MAKFDKLCRLCLIKCDEFENLVEDTSIRPRTAIKDIFGISVTQNHGPYPVKVCSGCSHKVLEFYNYFLVVHKNQDILRHAIEFRGIIPPKISLQRPQAKRPIITQIPQHIYQDGNGFELDSSLEMVEINMEERPDSDFECISQNDTKNCSAKSSRPLMSLEEQRTLNDKLDKIKTNPDMTDDEKIRIFYGLKCEYCVPHMEFDTLALFGEHCEREHELGISSFVCCKTRIKREVLLDHLEFHLGTPNVRILRSNVTKDTSHNEDGDDFEMENEMEENNEETNEETNEVEVDNTFPCEQCDKVYNFKSSLKRHLKVVHGIGRQYCNECEKEFDDPIKLKKHKHMFHDTEAGPFICELCPGEQFDIRQALYNHRRKHARDTIKNSTPNPAALGNISSASISVPVPENDTNEESAQLTPNDSLSSSINYPKKPFKCNICRSSFHHPRNLRIHMTLKHQKGKPLKTLSRYQENSKNEALLKCKLCGFGTIYRNNLKRHIRVMHQDQAQTPEEIESLVEGPVTDANGITTTAATTNGEVNESDKSESAHHPQIPLPLDINGIKKETEEDPTTKDDSILYQCLSDALLP